MMQPLIYIPHASCCNTLATKSLSFPLRWNGRSRVGAMCKGFSLARRLLHVPRFQGKLLLSRMPSVRSQAGSVPQRRKSDMMSQLELEKSEAPPIRHRSVNGIFWLLLLNIGIYVADRWLQVDAIKLLYLYHDAPRWYQFITATFCHVNWSHLSSNLFFLYIFGKLVEEEEGGFALWASYLITGAGANLVSWLILPGTIISVGASGAVFGLFAVSVLVKISWDWRKILEVLILGQFVIEKVMEAAQASAQVGGSISRGFPLENINHIAHLSGALLGVALIWLVSRIPPGEPKERQQKKLSHRK
uniref:Rhomboid protein Ginbi_RBL11 n=1 Tax=Ginkgo biloba TaxID=3311 RepID=A0A0A7E833_GINBI|nr:rhomboid protein Ginbi_RBL11 [Ginkgo biloba]